MQNIFKEKNKLIHIAIILLGIIFILLGAFHTNMWFDESYSVAISSNHNFAEIWTIGGHDVHPILYYWMLRLISLIFGNKILLYRLFSSVATIALGIFGYTHIRKDFGEKTGLLFSFLTFFLPTNVVYTSEIRMYTWAMLFVTIMATYAYRIAKEGNIKNWIIFTIFSLASAYIHYYGLMSAGIINLILFVYFIINVIKERKFTQDLKKFIVSAVIQIFLYIPWLVYFFLQVSQVSGGFWIGIKFPDILIEIFTFQFTGSLEESYYIDNIYAIIYGLIFCLYIFYLLYKNKKNRVQKEDKSLKPAILAFSIYAIVILSAIIISIIVQPIIYARYFLVITGLFMFFISFIIAKLGNKYGNVVICILTILIATTININLIQHNYDLSNNMPVDYIKANIQKNDILVYANDLSGFVISANFPDNMQYFYNKENWNVEEAYKAYGPNMKTVNNLDDLKSYTGRIWFIGSSDYSLFEEALNKYDLELIDKNKFSVEYKKYQYTFVLVDKKTGLNS